MESNTSENAKGVALQEARDGIAEPYVGMPIYLDDNFFSLLGGGQRCPIEGDEDMADEDMANEGTPNQGTPNQGMPNQCMPNQCMPNQCMPNECMPNQCMPNQGTGGMTEGEFGYNINDCAAGCPLAMAYVPWQSWDKTYEDEVAFRVGTVFPSLDLPFLGGKRK